MNVTSLNVIVMPITDAVTYAFIVILIFV